MTMTWNPGWMLGKRVTAEGEEPSVMLWSWRGIVWKRLKGRGRASVGLGKEAGAGEDGDSPGGGGRRESPSGDERSSRGD